jgi:hypothetical protein
MKRTDLNRRDFGQLAAAAVGGLLAGVELAQADDKDKEKPKAKDPKKDLFLQEPHVCRGLNTCKGNAKGSKNTCAGQGDCATAMAHTCAGDNECRGQGGCGEKPADNACKGMGKCHVPLNKSAWPKARKRFEEAMTKAKKKFGDAPKAKSE